MHSLPGPHHDYLRKKAGHGGSPTAISKALGNPPSPVASPSSPNWGERKERVFSALAGGGGGIAVSPLVAELHIAFGSCSQDVRRALPALLEAQQAVEASFARLQGGYATPCVDTFLVKLSEAGGEGGAGGEQGFVAHAGQQRKGAPGALGSPTMKPAQLQQQQWKEEPTGSAPPRFSLDPFHRSTLPLRALLERDFACSAQPAPPPLPSPGEAEEPVNKNFFAYSTFADLERLCSAQGGLWRRLLRAGTLRDEVVVALLPRFAAWYGALAADCDRAEALQASLLHKTTEAEGVLREAAALLHRVAAMGGSFSVGRLPAGGGGAVAAPK
jgi:hypothetical protein